MAQLKATTVNGNITVKGTSRLEGNVTVTGAGGTGKGIVDANMSATNINSGTLSNDRLNKSSTSAQGIVQLNDATNSTATNQAATANAVKKAYDRAETKEPAFSKGSSFNKNFETSTGTLKAPGTAAVGTSNNVPRADHVHPAQTTVSGNAGSATKLATGRKIGDATFDGTANISMSSILGTISTGSSGNGGGTRYCKIASVDVSSGTYNNCVGRMFVSATESNGFNGILYFYFRTGTSNTSISCSLRWESISNNSYSNSIIAVKTADGKFDLYLTSKNTYETFQIFVVAGSKEKMTLHSGQAFSTTQPTAAYTSNLQAQASQLNGFSDTNANTANTIVRRDGSGNFSAGTVTANLSGNSSSSTKLQTARQINGTNFDGTANITTTKWGTARTITLGGNTSGSVSLDGSANVTLSATVNHSAQATKLQTARQINGTNFDGTGNITTAKWGTSRTITLGGDLTGSVSLDGSANVTLSGQVANDSHNHSELTSKESSIYLKDHGNGNITLSAAKNGSGTIGSLYLGYNSGNYCTTAVRLERTMNWQGGHTIIDSSGKIPWSALTGLPSSFTPSSHTHDDRYYTESEMNTKLNDKANTSGSYSGLRTGKGIIHDTRGANRAPNYYDRQSARYDFVESSQVGYGSGWNTLLTVSPWTGYNDTHRQVQLAFNGGNLGLRWATSDTAWSGWQSIYHGGNKPTWSDVGAIRAGNWSTNGGQDLLVHGKRALVGMSNGELHLGYGNDFTSIKCGNGYTVYHSGNLKPYQMDGTNSGWFRTTGENGIYFGTHGGGFHMTDGTWIRTYNNKNLYCSRAIYASGELKTDSQVALPGGAFLNKDTLRLAKGYNGQYSQIMFNGQSNDDGRIIHWENNNSSQLWLMPSDDHNSGTDEVVIGSISARNGLVDFQGGTWSRAVTMNTAGNITAIGNMDAANIRSGAATRITNFNARHASGWYAFSNNATARPNDWGIALCIQWGSGTDFCWIVVGTNNGMWTRWYVNGAWTGWAAH